MITHSTIEAYRVVGTLVIVGPETRLVKFEGEDDNKAMLAQQLIWAEHHEIAADIPWAYWRVDWMRQIDEDPDQIDITEEEEIEAVGR